MIQEEPQPQWLKILIAGAKLADNGQTPFTAEQLIVASWQENPQVFGLRGYSDLYPDSNKVISHIVGVKGLVRRGLLSKEGEKLYSVSYFGLKYLEGLTGEPIPLLKRVSQMPKDLEKFLDHLENTTVYKKFEEGLRDTITFADATEFWGGTKQKGLKKAEYDHTCRRLATLAETLDEGQAELSTRQIVNGDTSRRLMNLSSWLSDKFSRHLKVLNGQNV